MKIRVNVNAQAIVYYLLSSLIILNSTVEWKYLSSYNFPERGLKYFFVIFLIFWIIFRSIKIKLHRREVFLLIGLLAYLSFYAYLSRYNVSSFFLNFVVMIALLFLMIVFLLRTGEYAHFLKAFENIIVVIGIVSLFFWFFGSVLDVLPDREKVIYFWADSYKTAYTYHGMYFENIIQNQKLLGSEFPRNCGIFTETPAYSGFLIFALLIEYFTSKDKIKIGILLLTILSVQSTKGYLLVILLFSLLFLTEQSQEKVAFNKIIKNILKVVILISVCYLIFWILLDKSSTSSYATRMSDMIAAIRAWSHHPIIGVGFNNNTAINLNGILEKSNNGLSMGITVLLAQGGLYLFLFYVGAFLLSLKGIKNLGITRRNYLIIAVILILNLFVSNSGFTIQYLFIVATCFAIWSVRGGDSKRVGDFS